MGIDFEVATSTADKPLFAEKAEALKPPSLGELLVQEYERRSKEKSQSLRARAKKLTTTLREKGLALFSRNKTEEEKRATEEHKKAEALATHRRLIKLQQKYFKLVNAQDILDSKQIFEAFTEDHLTSSEREYFTAITKELKKRQHRTQAVLSRVRRQAEAKLKNQGLKPTEKQEKLQQEMAYIIFKIVTGKEPEHPPTLLESKFVVGLKVYTETDMKHAYKEKRELPGGFYQDKALFPETLTSSPLRFSKPSGIFSLVVVSSEDVTFRTEKHEVGHGINRAIHNALVGIGRADEMWPSSTMRRSFSGSPEVIHEVQEIVRSVSENKTLKHLFHELMQSLVKLMPEALTIAQDELTTDFYASKSFSHVKRLLLHPHSDKQEEYYNFFELSLNKAFFNSPFLIEAYDMFVNEYNSFLLQKVQRLKLLDNYYGNHCWYAKEATLLEFMRTTPLHLWDEKVNELFAEDMVKALEHRGMILKTYIDILQRSINDVREARNAIKQGLADLMPEALAEVQEEFNQLSLAIDLQTSAIDLNTFYDRFSDPKLRSAKNDAFDFDKIEKLDLEEFSDSISAVRYEVLYELNTRMSHLRSRLNSHQTVPS